MKKYYVVSAKRPCSETIEIKVTDNKNGYNILMEIEAKNYNEAKNGKIYLFASIVLWLLKAEKEIKQH